MTTFPHPATPDTAADALARTNVRRGFLEMARRELRGAYSALVELRRGDLPWDSPQTNCALVPVTEQIASALALLEEME